MGRRNPEIEAFVRRIVAEIEEVRAAGAVDAGAIAAALNERGVTTRKGRGWAPATVAKFMSSPGARRHGLAPHGRRESGRPPP